MTAPSTPNSVAAATTPKGIPSVGNNTSLDQSGQENDTVSMSDDLALQSLLTAASASVATSSSAVTPSTTPSGMCMSMGGGDPMDSLRGVTDLLDGSGGSGLLGLDSSSGSVGGCVSNNGGLIGPEGGGGMGGAAGGMSMGNNMSNVQMGSGGGMGMGGMHLQQQQQQQVGGGMGKGGNSGNCQMSNALAGNSMDNTYMQNRIFVFSTQMANKGAEMVINGHFLSIIAYHCSQPETKKILEVSPGER